MPRIAEIENRFLVFAILVLGFLTFLILRPFVDWVILGFLVAFVAYPGFERMRSLVRKRSIAAAIMLILILLAFFIPFFFVVSVLIRDVSGFAATLGQVSVEGAIAGFLRAALLAVGADVDPTALEATAAQLATAAREKLVSSLASFATNLASVVLSVALGLFIFGFTLFYGFVDGPRFVNAVRRMIPLREAEKNDLFAQVRAVVSAVFVGHLLIALVQASLGTIGFLILGVPNTFFWGFAMLLLAIVPLFGPVLIWVPVGIYLVLSDAPVNGLFSSSPAFAGFGVLFVVGPIVSTIDNLLRPKLIGSRADVHPLLILIGALGGIFVLGFTGFVVGPLVLALLLAILRVFRRHWADEGLTVAPEEPKKAKPDVSGPKKRTARPARS